MFFKRLQSYFATDEFLITWGLRWHKTERIMVKGIVVVVLFCFCFLFFLENGLRRGTGGCEQSLRRPLQESRRTWIQKVKKVTKLQRAAVIIMFVFIRRGLGRKEIAQSNGVV